MEIEQLQAEIEYLKSELEMERDDCRNAKQNEIMYHKAYDAELMENAKLRDTIKHLRCTALHAIVKYLSLLSSNAFKQHKWVDYPVKSLQITRHALKFSQEYMMVKSGDTQSNMYKQ